MSSELKVRTRYAPSPTGYFHIGGARTALFNYLYAKHMGGEFIVRIEDTDIERNVEGGIESQLNNLKWLHLNPDESILNPGQYGPYIQSQKLEHYKKLAYKLLEEGKAYRCFCDEKDLEEQREIALKNHQTPKYSRKCLHLSEEEIQQKLAAKIPYVIRLKMKDNVNIEWDDLVRGHMCVPTSALTDPVILKSNNYPMYNFAVVIDDYDMKITHVLRGEEHISNTPYQIAIKEALGYDKQPIRYGHMSIIVDETGKKLSKRNKALKQFIEDYRNMGFPFEGIDNFLALLGWSDKNNKEILSLGELVKVFDFDRLSKSPAYFDYKKMLWISNEYIKKMSDEQYLDFVKPFIKFDINKITNEENQNLMLLTFKPQVSYADQINELVEDIFNNIDLSNTASELLDFMKTDNSISVIKAMQNKISSIDKLTLENSKQIIDELKKELPIKGKEFFMPLRIVCIGKEHGPEMNKIMTIIGKERILKNINKFLNQ